MSRKVLWSRDALDELKEAFRWIAQDNPVVARRVRAAISETAEKLGDRPIGRRGRVSGTYEKSVTGLPYILAYALRMRPDGEEDIVILRVIHTARNWIKESWSPRG